MAKPDEAGNQSPELAEQFAFAADLNIDLGPLAVFAKNKISPFQVVEKANVLFCRYRKTLIDATFV